MTLTRWALWTSLVGLLLPGVALAQSQGASGVRPGAGVAKTAYPYADYYSQDPPPTASPSDAPAAEAAPAAADNGSGDTCGDDSCGDDSCGEEEEDPGCTLMSLPILSDSFVGQNGFTFGGWTEIGYQNKPDGAFTGNGPFLVEPTGVSAAGEWLRPNLNQQWLYGERVADGAKGLDWGFRADLIYGVDGNDAQAFGNPPGSWDFLNGWDYGVYNWAMPQLYGQVAAGDLSVKIGHWFTPTGYEVIPPAGNFFFSRQITWYNGEAFTHTGALANYTVNDKLTLMGGWALGWDSGFDQLRGGNMGLSGFTWNPTEKTSFAYWTGYGNFGWRGLGFTNGIVLSQQWTDKFTTVHQWDLLTTNNPTTFNVEGIARNDIALVNYAFYNLTEKLILGARLEWWKADGISYYTFTYGVNIKVAKNLIIRPELRELWAPGVPNPGAPGTIAQNVFDVYATNQIVFGCDMVWTY